VVKELHERGVSKMKWLIRFAASALTVAAADVSGNWKATADFGGQTMERTFTFKVEGNKLTGETTSSILGKSTITDGKVEGDNVSFTINTKLQDNDTRLIYKGKVNSAGNEIHFTVEGTGNTFEWVAKKVS